VPAAGSAPSHIDLKEFLRSKLPDYMIPAAFVSLDSLPLTANGKIDQAALPDPWRGRNDTPDFAEPRTAVQKELAGIWQALLGIDRVSIHDNFFDLGGHSLLVIQLIARIEKQFQKTLPVAMLFESPTIRQLADIIGAKSDTRNWSPLIEVQREGGKLPFFWIHGDLTNTVLPGYLGADQPLYGLEHQATDGKAAVHTQVESIARYYIDQVRRVRPHGPYLLGGYSFGALLAFEMAHQLTKAGDVVALLFMLEPTGKRIEHNPSPVTFWSEIERHQHAIAELPPGKKLSYVGSRLAGVVRTEIVGRTRRPTRKLVWKYCLVSGRPLPPSVRSAYIVDVYRKATQTYVAKPYSGPAVIFKLQNCTYQPPWDWLKLLTGELEIHEGPGDHMSLREEPYVSLWAEPLNTALHRAQTTARGSESTEEHN
jgi:thioesterase domain-containing protein/acyl carrier protein